MTIRCIKDIEPKASTCATLSSRDDQHMTVIARDECDMTLVQGGDLQGGDVEGVGMRREREEGGRVGGESK